MKVEIEDVLFWMDAIRNSEDRYRTLESFWKGQIRSKVWLINNLDLLANAYPKSIVIHGGWNGVLASLLFNSKIMNISHITSVDIDTICEETARTVNKRQEIEGRFKAVTADMCTYQYEQVPDIVINTSCEHITQEQYEEWLNNVPEQALIVLQSNNYFELEEHIRCSTDLEDFKNMSKINVMYNGEFETPKYKRFMLIGKKK
jgi:hypothetical protein